MTSEDAILTATLLLHAAPVFDGTRTDAIARRAGVSKATMDVRSPSPDDVVLAALSTLAIDVRAPDTGVLEGDPRELVHELIAVFSDGPAARLTLTVVNQMARKPVDHDLGGHVGPSSWPGSNDDGSPAPPEVGQLVSRMAPGPERGPSVGCGDRE